MKKRKNQIVNQAVEVIKRGTDSVVEYTPDALGVAGGGVAGGMGGATGGAAVGFLVGGPVGAAIGFTVGFTGGTIGGSAAGLKFTRWVKRSF